MKWDNKFRVLPFFCFIALFIYTSSAFAASKTIVLMPFKVSTSTQYENLKTEFNSLLSQRLEIHGYSVSNAKTPENNAEILNSIRTSKATGAVSGSVIQIGNTVSIDAAYMDSTGKSTSFYIEASTANDVVWAIDEIVQKVAQYQNIDPSSNKGIVDIKVSGTGILDPEIVLARVAVNRGDIVNSEIIDEEVRKIWNTGYFNNVYAEVEKQAEGDVLVFYVEEKPKISDVIVEGSKAVKLSEILDVMNSRSDGVLNEKLLATDIQRITELYRKKGYYLAEVTYNINTRTNGTAALVFQVKEGNKLFIRDIVFDGIENLKTKDLKKYLSLKKKGLFSFVTGTGVLKEEDLERDAQTVAAFAVNEGYIQAQVGTPEVSYTENGIIITHRINEGIRYALGDINFAGNLIAEPEVFYEIIKLDEWKEKNTYFSLTTMQDDVRLLTQYYNDQGYAFASVNLQDAINPETGIVNITYILEPGDKVYINRVDVEGNYHTRDNVILREMRLADGDLFSGSLLGRTQERLEKTGYFDAVAIDVVPTSDPTTVDLDIKVEEGSTGAITGGVGYSTYDGFGVSASVSQDNLFGRGYKVGLQGYFSGKEVQADTYFWNPRVYNTNLGSGLGIYALTQEWEDYDKDTVGARLSFAYPLGEYTNLEWSYRIDQYKIYNISAYSAPSILNYKGVNWSSVVSLGIVRDTTNSIAFPTRGTKTKLGVQYGGNFLGGTDNFVKPNFEIGGYYGLNATNVLHARATVSAVFKNTSKVIPAFERFYIGGINSIRGYTYEDISPRDQQTGEEIGADRVAYGTFEYIWLFEPDLGLSVVPFFDFAYATDSSQSSFFDKSYYSAGLELRWRSPMGNLRFAYGFPLSKNVEGKKRNSGRLEFTIGQAF